jgi:hypothetical protein
MSKKTIELISYSELSYNPKGKVIWDDIWIHYKDHHRKTISLGPMIGSLSELLSDINLMQSLAKENHSENLLDYFNKEFWHRVNLFDQLLEKEFVIYKANKFTNIWCAHQFITREIVERVIILYLKDLKVLRSEPRFVWRKNNICINPVSVGCNI